MWCVRLPSAVTFPSPLCDVRKENNNICSNPVYKRWKFRSYDVRTRLTALKLHYLPAIYLVISLAISENLSRRLALLSLLNSKLSLSSRSRSGFQFTSNSHPIHIQFKRFITCESALIHFLLILNPLSLSLSPAPLEIAPMPASTRTSRPATRMAKLEWWSS